MGPTIEEEIESAQEQIRRLQEEIGRFQEEIEDAQEKFSVFDGAIHDIDFPTYLNTSPWYPVLTSIDFDSRHMQTESWTCIHRNDLEAELRFESEAELRFYNSTALEERIDQPTDNELIDLLTNTTHH